MGLEVLKNLVFGGIGLFIIVDVFEVFVLDLGNNYLGEFFFIFLFFFNLVLWYDDCGIFF